MFWNMRYLKIRRLNPVKILCSIKTDLQLLLKLELTFCYPVLFTTLMHNAAIMCEYEVK